MQIKALPYVICSDKSYDYLKYYNSYLDIIIILLGTSQGPRQRQEGHENCLWQAMTHFGVLWEVGNIKFITVSFFTIICINRNSLLLWIEH